MKQLTTLGRRLSAAIGDVRETAFLFQRLSVVIQRYNNLSSSMSFFGDLDLDLEPDSSHSSKLFLTFVFSPSVLCTLGHNNNNNNNNNNTGQKIVSDVGVVRSF